MRPPPVIIPLGRFAKLQWRLRERLPMWVIYRPPYNGGIWVTRMHITFPVYRPTRFVITHDTLEELRDLLPPGLTNIGRHPNDLPEIEEVWL